jgi:hypothetical protein
MSNMQDWNAYRDALLERVGDFAKLSPERCQDKAPRPEDP